MIEIEKGIPYPTNYGGHVPKYPWEEMGIGHSFFVPVAGNGDQRRATRLANIGNTWARRNGHDVRFSGRSVEGGVRVWRVK